MAHIKMFGLSCLRKLNFDDLVYSTDPYPLKSWFGRMVKHNTAQVNIFSGPNGGGKSTVLDLIDTLRDASGLGSLQRENLAVNSQAGFVLAVDRGEAYGLFSQTTADEALRGVDHQNVQVRVVRRGEGAVEVSGDFSKFGADPESYRNFSKALGTLECVVRHEARDKQSCSDEQLAEELCFVGKDLVGLTSSGGNPECEFTLDLQEVRVDEWPSDEPNERQRTKPISVDRPGILRVWLGDDTRQWNNVARERLPSGWIRYGELLGWLRDQPEGAICLLEEPETHLHPRLQRQLAVRMAIIAKARDLQLFIASHSPVFLDPGAWPSVSLKLFDTTDGLVEELTNPARLLDALGIRSSDIMQANGVIWVEGPSDRIYLKHFIQQWCLEHDMDEPRENTDYIFSLYGGATLSHYGVGASSDQINLLRMNRNAFVLMDRDCDFGPLAEEPLPHSLTSGKQTILFAQKLRSRRWVTRGYTFESYLEPSFVGRYFTEDEDGRLTTSRSKVKIALKYIEEFSGTADLNHREDFHRMMKSLMQAICIWNS